VNNNDKNKVRGDRRRLKRMLFSSLIFNTAFPPMQRTSPHKKVSSLYSCHWLCMSPLTSYGSWRGQTPPRLLSWLLPCLLNPPPSPQPCQPFLWPSQTSPWPRCPSRLHSSLLGACPCPLLPLQQLACCLFQPRPLQFHPERCRGKTEHHNHGELTIGME